MQPAVSCSTLGVLYFFYTRELFRDQARMQRLTANLVGNFVPVETKDNFVENVLHPSGRNTIPLLLVSWLSAQIR